MNVKKYMFLVGLIVGVAHAVDLELVRAYQNPRVRAFLDMIAFSEGTDHDLGYRTQYTGAIFKNFNDHPRQKLCGILKGKEVCSTAAGRYQFLARTWDDVAPRIQADNFSPLNQDYAALELIRQWGALTDIIAGKIGLAIKKLNRVWASFTGSPYGQPTRPLSELKAVYLARLAGYQKMRKDKQGRGVQG